MITIRSATNISKPTLICLEATLNTLKGVYSLSSDRAVAASNPADDNGLFGGVSWPQSRFELADDMILQQKIFLPHDGSAAAFYWQLRGKTAMHAHLTLQPFFAGCGPRSYRDLGFRFEPESAGGRLTWLPSVLGPTIIADTNGQYRDLPPWPKAAGDANLVSPGLFEFELNNRPAVLILINERVNGTQVGNQMGAFLAGLSPRNRSSARGAIEPSSSWVTAA